MGRHSYVATAFVALIAASYGVSGSLLDFLVQSNNFDGVSRVQALTSEQEVVSASLAVVFVTADNQQSRNAEELAQILATRTVPATVYRASAGVVKDSVNGQVFVFRGGRRFTYNGVREAGLIVKFISNLENANLKTITGKLDKIAFDHTRGTKLVGYFLPATPELLAFEQAASLFGTQVSFYTIMDPVVAKHLKMNATGQIHLVREFDRHPVVCPANPATLADIQQLLVFNRDSLIKVTPLNVLDPSLTASSAILLVTDSSPFSFHLLKLIVRSQRQSHAGATASPATPSAATPTAAVPAPAPSSRVLWVDTADFPTFDAVSQPIHGLAKLPGLGFFDSTTQTVKWMDLLPLNGAPTDKIAEEANLLLVKAFLIAHPTATVPSAAPTVVPAAQAKTEL